VRVQHPGCLSLTTTATATAQAPGMVDGMLPPDTPWLNGTPAGSPNGWRASAGVSESTIHFKAFQNALNTSSTQSVSSSSSPDVGVAAAGPSVSAGLVLRWFTLLADARWIWGSTNGTAPAVTYGGQRPILATMSSSASLREGNIGIRLGPRFPIYFAALSFGVGGSLGVLGISPSQSSNGGVTMFAPSGDLWGAIDARPLCDWGVQVGGGASLLGDVGGGHGGGPSCSGVTACSNNGNDTQDPQARYATSWFVHVVYEPNRLCERQRAGLYRLKGTP